jgi:hypothetical protein
MLTFLCISLVCLNQTCDYLYPHKGSAYIMLVDLCSVVRARLSLISIYRDMVAATDATVMNFQESIIDRLSSIFPLGHSTFLSLSLAFKQGTGNEGTADPTMPTVSYTGAASVSAIGHAPSVSAIGHAASSGAGSSGEGASKSDDAAILSNCKSLCSMVFHEVRWRAVFMDLFAITDTLVLYYVQHEQVLILKMCYDLQVALRSFNWMQGTILLDRIFSSINKFILPRQLQAYKNSVTKVSNKHPGFNKEVLSLSHGHQWIILLSETLLSRYHFYFHRYIAMIQTKLEGIAELASTIKAPKVMLHDFSADISEFAKLYGGKTGTIK